MALQIGAVLIALAVTLIILRPGVLLKSVYALRRY